VAVLRSWFAAGLVAGLALAVIEVAGLGAAAPDLLVAAGGLLLALGFLVGIALWLPDALLGRAAERRVVAALVRALPVVPLAIYLGRHLFDGAKAQTLPGASLGPLWVPAAAYLATALGLLVGAWIFGDGGPVRRAVLAVPALAGAAALELANRRLLVSEYPELHLVAGIATVGLLGLGLGLALGAGRATAPRGPAIVAWSLVAALAAVGTLVALVAGLSRPESRRRVAEAGTHLRHLGHVLRGAIDRDDDGFSPVLGGGDCDDGAAATNPGALDAPGDAIDQDCDGADAARPPPAVAIGGAAWTSSPARAALLEGARGANVLFLSVDALRLDAIEPATTPRLAGLLAASARFERAWAPGAGTDVSLGGVVTGRIDPWTPVPTTLIEGLAASGRRTDVILPREVLRYAGRTLLARGAARLEEVANDGEARDVSRTTSAAETSARALAALGALVDGGRPWFLWVHYFDAHEHLQIEARDPALVAAAGGRDLGARAGKYAALVSVIDREVGRVLDDLAARGLDRTTIVVLFGDHGESLAEDPRLPDNHGRFVYEPLVRIPLALRGPGIAPGPRAAAVSLLDLPATLVELLGLAPLDGAFGTSLAPLLVADDPAALAGRALPLHDSEQWGVVRWPLKLLVRPRDNLIELYDLEADPREAHDLAAARPADVAALKAARAGWPQPDFDRTRKGRARREALARPPAPR
jgi:hypothetical protein